MPNDRQPEKRRSFTFVDFDINRRGVTDVARAHLMKDRLRSKREARSEWVARNQFLPLRWMRPKGEGGQSTLDAANKPTRLSADVERPRRNPTSHSALLVHSQEDSVTGNPFTKGSRSVPSSPTVQCQENALETSPSHQGVSFSPNEDANLLDVKPHGSLQGEVSSWRNAGTTRIDHQASPLGPKQRRASLRKDSEVGLSLMEQLRIASTPTREPGTATPGDLVLAQVEESVEQTLTALAPWDCTLIRYFAANADAMLGLDQHPDIVHKYDPVINLFVPFALASEWCLETMVVLLSAYHHQRSDRPPKVNHNMLDAEKQYLATRQNAILARTRLKISALANQRDSTDEDVVAFLFLALAEYRAGNREMGLMHFEAWRAYCEMRRRLGIIPCGLRCKTIVWWCIAMLVEEDVALDSILSPSTKVRVRAEPAKLFRYLAVNSETVLEDEKEDVMPRKAGRRATE